MTPGTEGLREDASGGSDGPKKQTRGAEDNTWPGPCLTGPGRTRRKGGQGAPRASSGAVERESSSPRPEGQLAERLWAIRISRTASLR